MKKVLTWVVFPIVIIVLTIAIVKSIEGPIQFKKERARREAVAIQRFKDIRTLEVAYKSKHGKFTASIDSLIDFYNNGQITIVKQIGSMDDSVAVARHLVKRENVVMAVKDTLLKDHHFVPDSLRYIPFSGGQQILMKAVVKKVSGVDVPLFEASAPFNALLNGMNHQLIVNLNAERTETDRYPGVQVGSVDAPNNNAGNWE
ncbi:MAG: hypothetical protein LKM37_06075 [Bacteroidales bacterium]|jgi:hypothetical protein|nr:hypothetical protein [Bacteroidales bacterium]MCI1734073.1 hypothetical protein [Bacteroidales bacterium]